MLVLSRGSEGKDFQVLRAEASRAIFEREKKILFWCFQYLALFSGEEKGREVVKSEANKALFSIPVLYGSIFDALK